MWDVASAPPPDHYAFIFLEADELNFEERAQNYIYIQEALRGFIFG